MTETEKAIAEIWALFRETDKRMQETDKRMQETDKRMQETDKRMRETDQQLKQLAQSNDRLDKTVERVAKIVERATHEVETLKAKWGRFVEYILAPGIANALQERGIPIHTISQRVKSKVPGKGMMEVDILGINQEYVLLVEAKSTLSNEDVKSCLENLAKFKSFFPEYAQRRLIGAVAGIEITGNADRQAYQEGLFVLGESEDNLVIKNDDQFQPKIW